MISLKLAYRNLIGAGIRTWLNVFVLSLSFVIIIMHKGMLDGWNRQARLDTIDWEIGGGQYWHEVYDPYDPFTIIDSHGTIPEEMQAGITSGNLTPVLISQATIYPEGRMQSALLKGIDPSQKVLKIPTKQLNSDSDEIPALIGTRMADNNKLNVGDYLTVRWRDVDGTFDAAEVIITGIFKTNVPAVDVAQLWIPIKDLSQMLQMPDEATIIVCGKDFTGQGNINGWEFKDHKFLLADIEEMIKMKSIGGAVLYVILMALALLAIFDTQVLSVFRRQKEIGTYMAMGMTRGQVIRLFTVEGGMHGILAAGVAAIYGIPLLAFLATKGISMPEGTDSYGLTIGESIFPTYSLGLVIGTIIIVLLTTTIVSFLPARKIAKMKPTEALKGKLQ